MTDLVLSLIIMFIVFVIIVLAQIFFIFASAKLLENRLRGTKHEHEDG